METAGKDFHVAVCHRHDGPLGLAGMGFFWRSRREAMSQQSLASLGLPAKSALRSIQSDATPTPSVADRLPVGTVPMVYDLAGAAGGLARPQRSTHSVVRRANRMGETVRLALALSINRVAVELLVLLCLS
jgi:hypothetical protein